MATTITHVQAARNQADFPADAKLKINGNVWSEGCPGHRFYTEVLAQKPSTVQKAIDLAGKLEQPFTVKMVQAHLKWMFTANGGHLEVDGTTYATPAKATKEPKAAKPAPKAKAKAKKPETKVAATRQRQHKRTQKLRRAA
jgi:hypothetical protein